MACKIRCPKCKMMLKEEGDGMKRSQGEYRIYDSSGHGGKRILFCLSCNHASHMSEVHKAESMEDVPSVFDIIHGKVKKIVEAGPDNEESLNNLLTYMEETSDFIKRVFNDE